MRVQLHDCDVRKLVGHPKSSCEYSNGQRHRAQCSYRADADEAARRAAVRGLGVALCPKTARTSVALKSLWRST